MLGVLHFRSLQQKLGFYSFVLSFVAMVTVSVLTYRVARDQVQEDREQLMRVYAHQIADDLESELRDTTQQVQLWGEADFVQASFKRPHDMNFGLFFDEVIRHQPKYDLIFTVGPDERIAAVNSIGREKAGEAYEVLLPGVSLPWLRGAVQGGKPQGIGWRQFATVNKLYQRSPTNSKTEQRYQIAVVAPVGDHSRRQPVGLIVAVLNWSYFQQVLDRVEKGFRRLDLSTGYAFLYPSDADTIIGHKYRDLYGTSASRDHHLTELHERAANNPTGTVRYKWREGWKIAALAKINLAELGPEFEWRLGVGINESDIFAPIQHLLAWFIMISSAVAFSMVLLNLFIGRKVSVSLNEFAQLARDAARGRFSQLARARTDDELGNLAQAFNEMLVSFRAQMPFTRIPNHYVVGNPIRTAEMFFGRQEDLQWLGKQLEHAGNKMVLLFGPRRIGKTSLLHQVCAGRASPNVLPFFFDTQQIIPELIENADFYHVLTREMLTQLPVILPELKAPFISTERFSPDTLRRLLRFIHDSEPHKVAVLLFDELENLEFKFNRGSLSADVLLFLAGLLDGNVPVSFVATGSDQLERLKFPDWHILTPKTIPRHIGLLTRNDARRLIVEPIRGYVLYDDGVPERILRITAGHPYYTQVVCQSLVDYLNQKQEFALSLAQLSEVLELVLDNPPPPLNHVWESFSNVEKTAAAGLAHVLAGEEQYVGTERVLASMPVELSAEARDPVKFRSALDHLSREDWVEKNDNGAYRFQLDLLRLWIGREHSIWQVADELPRSPK